MAEPDAVPQKSRAGRIAGPKKRPHPQTYATLGQMLDMLPECFVQCHKSYLVNMACIVELRPGSVLLRSGREVPVSQRQRTSVRDSFFHYVGLNAR